MRERGQRRDELSLKGTPQPFEERSALKPHVDLTRLGSSGE